MLEVYILLKVLEALWDLLGLAAFWNVQQKLTFIMWFSTLIPKMYFFFFDFFFIKSYYDLKLFISYVFVKKFEL